MQDVIEEEIIDQVEEEVVEEVEEEEIILSIGDEKLTDNEDDEEEVEISDEEKTPLIRQMRQKHKEANREKRELERKNKEYEQRLEALESKKSEAIDEEVGEMPTQEDFDWDEDRYKAGLHEYFARKGRVEAKKTQHEDSQRLSNEAWKVKADRYQEHKQKVKFKDYAEVEADIMQTLNANQQAWLIDSEEDVTNLVYAIGKNKERLHSFAGLKTEGQFNRALGKLESKLVVEKKAKPKPAPETVVKGSAQKGLDSTMQKLIMEAEKTKDISKVVAYRNKIRSQGR